MATHYDEMQQRRWAKAEDALDPRIYNLRRLNNWIKSVSKRNNGAIRLSERDAIASISLLIYKGSSSFSLHRY